MKDLKILKELRKGPLQSMKDDEYAMIEEQVTKMGIDGLNGYAKRMIEKGMRDMASAMKKSLRDITKHEGGGHDQASHGSWAGNGAGGKNIQDMSLDDQDEFTSRMTSAKSWEEQKKIIADFSSRNKKAVAVSTGDMVSWNSSGGTARGKVIRVVREGKINVPDSSFEISAEEGDPAVLIQLYRDGKPTDTKVGHKMSTLKKNFDLAKHGNHNQSSHGNWSNDDDSEGEDESESKNPKPKFVAYDDDSEGEFADLDADDPRWMDDMDILRPPKRKS
jgi:hypothetical protein